tara:strand:- start:748 stop:1779 length:1032 start_codon:yes stop_codon:yes gene_type:complete
MQKDSKFISKRSAGTLQQKRIQLPWPEDRDLRILSIDGGGIKGIFPAAILAELEKTYLEGEPIGDYFDYICGTSTGGIIALGLGKGLCAKDLLDLYIQKGERIFPQNFKILRKIVSLAITTYSSKNLRQVLNESLGDIKFGDSKTRLCIPSFEGKYGEVLVRKTNHHPDYRLDYQVDMAQIGMETSAAPSFLRTFSDGQYHFVDGGIWANNPIMIGLIDALTCYDVSRDRIKILSIGCGEKPYQVSWLQRHFNGVLSWANIIFAAMNLQSQNALGQAGLLIGRHNIVRLDASEYHARIGMDDVKRAIELLPQHANDVLKDKAATICEIFLMHKIEPYENKNIH